MPKFLFVYHGGKAPDSPEDGQKQMVAWTAWFADIGAALIDPGAPVGQSRTVIATGVTGDGGANPASGYSVISADSVEAATEIAKGCPMLGGAGGSVEVAELIDM